MAATVGATLSGVTFALRHAGEGPYQSSGGNYYFFGRDSVNTGNVEPHKASDPTSSFTAQTAKTMSSATTTAIETMACYPVGNVIHVATQISTGSVYYNFYTMDTDTWGLASSELVQSAAATTFAPTANSVRVSLVVRSNGNVVFAYGGGVTAMSGTFNTCYYRERTGTNTFGTATKFDNAGSVNWGSPLALLGASNRVHLFFTDSTNGRLYQRTLSAANALQTFPASQYATTTSGSLHVHMPGASYVSGANTQVAALAFNASMQPISAYLTSADSPTPSSAVVSTTATSAGQQTRAYLAADSTTLHALYSDNTTQHLNYATSTTDGATWSAITDELTATVNFLSANVYTRSGTKYLAMVLDDGGTIKYAEITLTSPASLLFEPNRTLRLLTLR